jgi:hypothetical protein
VAAQGGNGVFVFLRVCLLAGQKVGFGGFFNM